MFPLSHGTGSKKGLYQRANEDLKFKYSNVPDSMVIEFKLNNRIWIWDLPESLAE